MKESIKEWFNLFVCLTSCCLPWIVIGTFLLILLNVLRQYVGMQ